MENSLEKKWVGILRLSKKINELEATVEHLNDELKSVSKMKRTTANANDTENLFPKFPA
jgi:platelet-activating factor acetylhydrolase IB subunit alpha